VRRGVFGCCPKEAINDWAVCRVPKRVVLATSKPRNLAPLFSFAQTLPFDT
jgi:hypothetical protein